MGDESVCGIAYSFARPAALVVTRIVTENRFWIFQSSLPARISAISLRTHASSARNMATRYSLSTRLMRSTCVEAAANPAMRAAISDSKCRQRSSQEAGKRFGGREVNKEAECGHELGGFTARDGDDLVEHPDEFFAARARDAIGGGVRDGGMSRLVADAEMNAALRTSRPNGVVERARLEDEDFVFV